MSDAVEILVLDLLEWLGPLARPYDEVLEVWSTSCPRLAVWEEACARGFVTLRHSPSEGRWVAATELGLAHLAAVRSRATTTV